jgi:hypothetical protein
LADGRYTSEFIRGHGGDLFIDALTVHKSDWQRIRDVLQPANDRIAAQVAALI